MTRMKSLKKDVNDESALVNGRFRNMGATVSSEYYQIVPFFFTREGATLNLVGQYRGKSAFLIASGPSFANVRTRYLRKPGIWTMTINNAIKTFRGNAAIVVDDPSRFTYSMWMDPAVQKFVPLSHMDKPLWDNRLIRNPDGEKVQLWQPSTMKVGDCPNIVGYRRNEKFMSKRFLYEDTVNWGCHKQYGGGRSVMLAALRILFLLGFRTVYLFGVDFNMDEGHKYHFQEERTPGAIRGNNSTYSKMMKWFEELQPHFLAEDFHVYNCNPDSKLKAFPFMDYKEAIRKASGEVGDTDHERVMGLYSKWEEKLHAYNTSKGAQIVQPKQEPNGKIIVPGQQDQQDQQDQPDPHKQT